MKKIIFMFLITPIMLFSALNDKEIVSTSGICGTYQVVSGGGEDECLD